MARDIGTRNGLNIMDKKTGEFIRFMPDDNDTTSISGIDVSVIFEDSYGELWFAGDFLEKLNRKDTSFINYFPNSGNTSESYGSGFIEIEEDGISKVIIRRPNAEPIQINTKIGNEWESTLTNVTDYEPISVEIYSLSNENNPTVVEFDCCYRGARRGTVFYGINK